MKTLDVMTSLKIIQQDFKVGSLWALRCMHRVLSENCRVQKLQTDYLEKLIA